MSQPGRLADEDDGGGGGMSQPGRLADADESSAGGMLDPSADDGGGGGGGMFRSARSRGCAAGATLTGAVTCGGYDEASTSAEISNVYTMTGCIFP